MPNFTRYISTLYHFTDRSNIPCIREHGGLLSLAKLEEFVIDVPRPGGNDLSHRLDRRFKGHQYVHLCFLDEHPMEYVARKDGRLPNPVFLTVHPSILETPGILFTEGVSNKAGVPLIDRQTANEVFDFDVMHGRPNFRDPETMRRVQSARKYEALVPDQVGIKYLTNLRYFKV